LLQVQMLIPLGQQQQVVGGRLAIILLASRMLRPRRMLQRRVHILVG